MKFRTQHKEGNAGSVAEVSRVKVAAACVLSGFALLAPELAIAQPVETFII